MQTVGVPRLFRLRMRPGRALVTFTADPEREEPISAAAGVEITVSEEAAANLIRERAVEIVEIIEPPEMNDPLSSLGR
jgi:hypothetical protein